MELLRILKEHAIGEGAFFALRSMWKKLTGEAHEIMPGHLDSLDEAGRNLQARSERTTHRVRRFFFLAGLSAVIFGAYLLLY